MVFGVVSLQVHEDAVQVLSCSFGRLAVTPNNSRSCMMRFTEEKAPKTAGKALTATQIAFKEVRSTAPTRVYNKNVTS